MRFIFIFIFFIGTWRILPQSRNKYSAAERVVNCDVQNSRKKMIVMGRSIQQTYTRVLLTDKGGGKEVDSGVQHTRAKENEHHLKIDKFP